MQAFLMRKEKNKKGHVRESANLNTCSYEKCSITHSYFSIYL